MAYKIALSLIKFHTEHNMIFFDDSTYKNLSDVPLVALFELCEEFLDRTKHYDGGKDNNHHLTFGHWMTAYSAIQLFADEYALPQLEDLTISDSTERAVTEIHETIDRLHSAITDIALQARLNKAITDARTLAQKKHADHVRSSFAYTFTDNELDTIHTQLTALAVQIEKSELFEDKHKQRILDKLDALQAEIHKRMTTLDRFWGFFSEAGVMLGKFGNDIKPLTDRIVEVGRIVTGAQARAEGLEGHLSLPDLSEPQKQLPDKSSDKDDTA